MGKFLLKNFIDYPLGESNLGFRPDHLSTLALNIVTNHIQKSLNRKNPCNHTLLLALDLIAAFKTVGHNLILRDILEAPLPKSSK